MDVLDKYKKAWDNQPEENKKVSKAEIYKMTKRKSSSVVKWILIVGLLEFLVVLSSYLFVDYDENDNFYQEIGLKDFPFYSQMIAFAIAIYFIYKFYLNYKNISVTADTKSLMNQILTTRKTVKTYFIVSLSFLGIFVTIITFIMLAEKIANMTSMELIITVLVFIISLAILLGLLWLFYQLLYGILLRKLNSNYKELAKLEE
ncbi:hypothetical protein [Tenacibaculum sp. M341]|uniref:hypothetical protein n=1 Tax=Tenacibaculum sp. M341 TaxID=2530339 RepID=UPI00104C9A3C|nr:hypothetical protein [Tenacibaculum sp. M341]TCI84404.1 hypothetical protein EYW44_21570 [Tenacibaculum sp. M341]